MSPSKTRLIAAGVIGIILLGFVSTLAYLTFASPGGKARQVKVDPKLADASGGGVGPGGVAGRPESQWVPKFKETYSLAADQSVKRIAPPFIAERQDFVQQRMGGNFAADRFSLLLRDDGHMPQLRGVWGGGGMTVQQLLSMVLSMNSFEVEGSQPLLSTLISGDFLVRGDEMTQQKRDAVLALIGEACKTTVVLNQQDATRQVIVVTGKLAYHPPASQPASAPSFNQRQAALRQQRGIPAGPHLILYQGPRQGGGYTSRGSSSLISFLQNLMQTRIVTDADLGGNNVAWEMDQSVYTMRRSRTEADPKQAEELLANIEAQTDLHFHREQRAVKVWMLARADGSTAEPATAPATLPAASAPLR